MYCNQCKFVEKIDDLGDLRMTCHRFPPQIVWNRWRDQSQTVFPEVTDYQWCGEFKVREKK